MIRGFNGSLPSPPPPAEQLPLLKNTSKIGVVLVLSVWLIGGSFRYFLRHVEGGKFGQMEVK